MIGRGEVDVIIIKGAIAADNSVAPIIKTKGIDPAIKYW